MAKKLNFRKFWIKYLVIVRVQYVLTSLQLLFTSAKMDNRIIINKRKQRINITKMTSDGSVPIFWKTMKFWVYGNQNMSQRIIKWIIAQNLIRLGTHLMCYTCLNHLLADSRLKDENATCPNCRCDIGTDLNSHAVGIRYCLRCRCGRCATILVFIYYASFDLASENLSHVWVGLFLEE